MAPDLHRVQTSLRICRLESSYHTRTMRDIGDYYPIRDAVKKRFFQKKECDPESIVDSDWVLTEIKQLASEYDFGYDFGGTDIIIAHKLICDGYLPCWMEQHTVKD